MRAFCFLAFLVSAGAAHGLQIFYGGERTPGSNSGLAIQIHNLATAAVYEDFDVNVVSHLVTFLTVDFIPASAPPPNDFLAEYEIRSGVSAGNGGTLIASADVVSSYTPTGRFSPQNEPEYRLRVPVNIVLAPGRYWFMARGVFGGLSFTDGTNGVGSPVANGNAFYSSVFIGPNAYFNSLGSVNYSYGVEGTPVPEPITAVVLLGAIAGARRRRPSGLSDARAS